MAEQQQQPPMGTEYTLQGVMRFLQIEWHNHERARNAWDIERAELKAKIAKQEGDFRNAKKLNTTMEKSIKMLESALKKERAKSKALPAGDQPPYQAEAPNAPNGTAGESERQVNGIDRLMSNKIRREDVEQADAFAEDKDIIRSTARDYLGKAVTELTYVLTPPTNPPPRPESQQLNGPVDLRPTAEEAYAQHQQLKRNQQAGLSHLPTLPNHHPAPVRQPPEYINANSAAQVHQAPPMSRQPAQPPPNYPPPSPDDAAEMRVSRERMNDGQMERNESAIETSTDAYGRQVMTRTEEIDPSQPLFPDNDDGWNFDDNLPMEPPLEAGPPPRRSDIDLFPSANHISAKSPPRSIQTRRRSSGSQRIPRKPTDSSHELRDHSQNESSEFKVRFALRGHLDVVRSIIFTGGGSPSEPEICTASDDGTLKRWMIPSNYSSFGSGHSSQSQQSHQAPSDLDIQSYFTHRGHEGIVTSLAACPASPSFSTGGRALGDGWVFSGGQDATIRVWERGRVDPKATLEGHTDAVWALAVLPAPASSILGPDSSSLLSNGGPQTSSPENRILLASGSADCTVRIWAVTAPPQLSSAASSSSSGITSRRGVGGARRTSITAGSNFPSSPQPSTASATPFNHNLIHTITFPGAASPTCITPLSSLGDNFVVSYTDASVLIFDTRTGEQVIGMASAETYDGTPGTGVNSVVVTSSGVEGKGGAVGEEADGATGSTKDGGVEGTIISGHEDRFVRFFDANSGQCTYSMLAHTSSIASLSLSPDGRELVSGGHDASLRFWSLEKRACIQEITSHRLMRGEGVVAVVWSSDGRWVVSGGGDGCVKVFGR